MRLAAPLLTLALACALTACAHTHENTHDAAPAEIPPPAASRSAVDKKPTAEPAPVMGMRFPEAAAQRVRQHGRRPVSNKDILELGPVEGGMSWVALFELVSNEAGVNIRYEAQNAVIKGRKITWTGTAEVAREDLIAWTQDLAVSQGLVLAQQGPADRKSYFVMDTANPWVTAQPTVVDESDLPLLAGRNGLYISCMLTVPEGVDVSRARNALTQLSTRTAGLGRVADFGNTQVILVADFAAIVATMQRMLDQMALQLYEESVQADAQRNRQFVR